MKEREKILINRDVKVAGVGWVRSYEKDGAPQFFFFFYLPCSSENYFPESGELLFHVSHAKRGQNPNPLLTRKVVDVHNQIPRD